jgi:hypothetical protein
MLLVLNIYEITSNESNNVQGNKRFCLFLLENQ